MTFKATSRGPGTSGNPEWGGVIKDPGVGSPFAGSRFPVSTRRTRGGAGVTAVDGPEGDAAKQAHANALNQYAFEKQMNIHEHKEKLASQLEFNERDRANETAHHAERMGNELGFHALKQLTIRDANDAVDVREMHRHMSAGNPQGAQAHANRYNSAQQLHEQSNASKSEVLGTQLHDAAPEAVIDPPHMGDGKPVPDGASASASSEARPHGDKPHSAGEVGDGVGEREKSDEVNAEPPENPPEAETPPTNVPGATENATAGSEKPADETPAAEEAKEGTTPPKVTELPPPTGMSKEEWDKRQAGTHNPGTQAPTPGANEGSGAISESVNVGGEKGHTRTDIPAQPNVGAAAAAAASQQQDATHSRVGQLRVPAEVVEAKQAPVSERYRPVAQAVRRVASAVNDKRKAQAEVNKQGAGFGHEGGTPIVNGVPAEPTPPAGRGRSASQLHVGIGDVAKVVASTARGAGKGVAEARAVELGTAAVAPEAEPVVAGSAALIGAGQGLARGVGQVMAEHAAKAVKGSTVTMEEGLARHEADRSSPPAHEDAKPGRKGGNDARLLPEDHPDAGRHNIEVRAHAAAHGYKPLPPSKKAAEASAPVAPAPPASNRARTGRNNPLARKDQS